MNELFSRARWQMARIKKLTSIASHCVSHTYHFHRLKIREFRTCCLGMRKDTNILHSNHQRACNTAIFRYIYFFFGENVR